MSEKDGSGQTETDELETLIARFWIALGKPIIDENIWIKHRTNLEAWSHHQTEQVLERLIEKGRGTTISKVYIDTEYLPVSVVEAELERLKKGEPNV